MALIPRLRVPEGDLGVFSEILELPDSVMDQLSTALDEVAPELPVSTFVQKIEGRVSLPPETIRRLVRRLVSYYGLYSVRDMALAEFVDIVIQAIQELAREAWGSYTDAEEKLKARLTQLLDHEATLGVVAKAANLGIPMRSSS